MSERFGQRTRRPRIGTLAGALLLAAAGPAAAERFQSFAGNTAGGPFFNRPNETPAPTGISVRYRTQVFHLQSSARCIIYSAQDYDGFLFLYRAPFNPVSPLTNLVAADDDTAEMGIGSSRLGVLLDAGTYVLVTAGFNSDDEGPFQNFLQCDADEDASEVGVQPLHGSCFFAAYPRDKQVCLQDRFAVKIDQVTNHATDGRATPVRFGSTDSAFFWFYNDRNFEVMIKVLDGCDINDHWWVFLAGITNQGHRIEVGDSSTQAVQPYTRALGPPAPAETHTSAFPCP